MASLTRMVAGALRMRGMVQARGIATTRLTCAEAAKIPNDSKEQSTGITGRIPEETEQSTGVERAELNAILDGNEDPYGLEDVRWHKDGTPEEPRLVPSHFDSRLVGCLCDPESEQINWWHLTNDGTQACRCGQYFKLVPVEGISP